MSQLNDSTVTGNLAISGNVSATNITSMQNEIDELNNNLGNYIKLFLSDKYTISTKNSYEVLPLSSYGKNGNTFQYNDNGTITVLRDCVALIAGSVYFTSHSTQSVETNWICATIYINDSYVSRKGDTVYDISPYIHLDPMYIGWLTSGDVISLKAISETVVDCYVGSPSYNTWLTAIALS